MKNALTNDQENMFKDISTLNQFIADNGLDLSNVKISQKTFSGLVLKKAKWEDVDLDTIISQNSVFEECVFTSLHVKDADFQSCTFNKCSFIKCQFIHSNFAHSNFTDCKFDAGDIDNTKFNGTKWHNINLQAITMKESSGLDAVLNDLLFKKCEFNKSGFSSSKMLHVKLAECKIHGGSFSNSKIDSSEFYFEGESVNFSGSTMRECGFHGLGSVLGFSMENVTGNNILIENFNRIYNNSFVESVFDKLTIKNVKFDWVIFYDAIINNSSFENLQILFAKYQDAKFSNSQFRNVTFGEEQIFDKAIFNSVKFENISKNADYQPSFLNTVFQNTEPF